MTDLRDGTSQPGRNERPSSLLRHVQLRGIWRGRGTAKVRWRAVSNPVSPYYVRLRRRNPVDHKVIRIRRLEVWW